MMLRRASAADFDAIVALQHAAYAQNRVILGVEPIPLQTDYRDVLATREVWLAVADGVIGGILILEPHADHLLIWSIATDTTQQHRGLGRTLLAEADARAEALGLKTLRLYTGTPLEHLVAWYSRNGYSIDRIEELPDRSITHMSKAVAVSKPR